MVSRSRRRCLRSRCKYACSDVSLDKCLVQDLPFRGEGLMPMLEMKSEQRHRLAIH